MMGKIHSTEGSAKLCFDESGDYILKHSFALQTAMAQSNPVWISLTKKACLPVMCESHKHSFSTTRAWDYGKSCFYFDRTVL